MPAKTTQGAKKHDTSRDRLNSANTSEGGGVKKVIIWPEWTEAELATEKWDLGGGGGKGRDKGKGHNVVVYDDPDGVLLPSSVADPSTVVWKRPNDELVSDILNKSTPIIVSNPDSCSLDLLTSNAHLFHSSLFCWIVGQLNALWQMRHSLSVDTGGMVEGEKEGSLAWRPWEHIQPHPKGMAAPQISLSGKYCVRLFWMGYWRKITIDDKLPFLDRNAPRANSPGRSRGDSGDERRVMELVPLYPRTAVPTELWPALLMKAILKVVALDHTEGFPEDEFGDSSVIHMLTGWTPYTITIKPSLSASDTWDALTKLLPLWKRPEQEPQEVSDEDQDRSVVVEDPRIANGCLTLPRSDYIIIGSFGSFCFNPLHRLPTVSALEEINRSESILKRFHVIPSDYNLRLQPSYPMLLTQLRDQPLVPPPKEPPLPVLQAPYYLGLKNRRRPPGMPTPPPTPPPVKPRFVELYPMVHDNRRLNAELTPDASGLSSETGMGTQLLVKAISEITPKHVDNKFPLMAVASSSAMRAVSDIGPPKPSNLPLSKAKSSGKDKQKSKVSTPEPPPIDLKWIDYLDFFAAFKMIQVFKNPQSFQYRDTYFDLPKTSGISTRAATASSSSKKGVSNSHLSSTSKPTTSKDNNYLFVDSSYPISMHFVFSSLSNWREGGKDTHRCHLSAPTHTRGLPQRSSHYRPSISISAASDQHLTTPCSTPDTLQPMEAGGEMLVLEGSGGGEAKRAGGRNKILCGSLVVETSSWSSAQFGDPVLRVSTTGIKGALFSLPAGRHVFKLHVRVPIGHHLEILSNSPFTLTNEDSVFAFLDQDCSRFVSCSSEIAETLLSSSKLIGNTKELMKSLQPLTEMLGECGLTANCATLLLASTLYSWSTLAKSCELNSKMWIAWKAYLCHAWSIIGQGLHPASGQTDSSVPTLRSQLRVYYDSDTGESEKLGDVPENWADRTATAEEEKAAKVITAALRVYTKARMEDSISSQDTQDLLTGSLPLLQPHAQKLGTTLLYGLFKLDPSLVECFPFSRDFISQAYSTVYCGLFPVIQPNSWTIILRRTLYISEPQMVAFYFSCPQPTSILRVIDNDDMTEMPRVFQATVPCPYHPNKNGYTLQGEAWLPSTATPMDEAEEKRWRLRIVTSHKDRPPTLEDLVPDSKGGVVTVTNTFNKQEVMDYCLPDRDDILLRYLLFPLKAALVTLQITASKQDALIRFEVLDRESSVATVEGRGVCTIPLCSLRAMGDEGDNKMGHKYVVQARILADSWPLMETAWPQIASIQAEDRQNSGQKPGSGKKPSMKGKDSRRKTVATIPPPTNLVQPQIDTNRPHWLLRVITKEEETVEVKKDTEKVDRLKTMMLGWEAAQPGRCKAAQKSRHKFLEARAIRDEKPQIDKHAADKMANEEEENSMSNLEAGTPTVPRPNTGPVRIWQMDFTPFIIKDSETPTLLDEAEQERRLAERQRIFKEYRASRQAVLELRNEDRLRRNEAKVKQLEMVDQWQMELDALRKNLNSIREGVREKMLAKERAEAERLKAQEESLSATGRDSKTGKGKGKKKK